jgi:hypothetical protein
MLRPGGGQQAVQNSDFETDLANWAISDGAAAARSTGDRHSGQASLSLTGPVEVSQTNAVSDMDRPILSFWYKSDTDFSVEFLTDGGPAQTQTVEASSDWTHAVLASGLGANHSGQVGVKFSHSGGAANIYIDEVSIAAGPLNAFLPLVIKD